MAGNTSYAGQSGQNSSSFPGDEEIVKTLILPEGWGVERDAQRREFAGYSVVGSIEDSEKEQGLLLADREYDRIACVLYPTSESFRKYNIKATQAVTSGVSLSSCLTPLEAEIENHSRKL